MSIVDILPAFAAFTAVGLVLLAVRTGQFGDRLIAGAAVALFVLAWRITL